VYFTGLYEPQETLLLKSLLSPGDTFVDVGAHWGYFSFLAAQRVGSGGRVLSIEADPRIFETLARNVELNGLSWVKVSHFAVGAGEGEVLLSGYSETQDNWGTSKVVNSAQGEEIFHVPSRALDSFLDEAGIGQVQLVKMDIEGAEVFALEGMTQGMKVRRYQRILLELHPAQIRELGQSPEQLLQQVSSAGYDAYVIQHSPEFTRKMAYGHPVEAMDLLKPLSTGDKLDAWPHFLFVAKGQPALPGVKL
jgi:FkbM family methyltransferase